MKYKSQHNCDHVLSRLVYLYYDNRAVIPTDEINIVVVSMFIKK